ncbi:MAG: transporter [Clostridia bacterium]|jgi:MFS family permease|nr:transporter [Clostridia bacterium]
MDYSKNIYKLYMIIFFHNLIFAYVIERLFWEQRGMTVFMVVLCEVIYAAVIVVLEIPSGIFADKMGRKKLLVISAVLSTLELVLLIYASSFIEFAFVAFLAGISGSCSSGAFNALLYDSLLISSKQNMFEKILGRINAFDFLAAMIAALSGSVLAKLYSFELNYILSVVSMSVALAFTLSLKEPPKDKGEVFDEVSEEGFKAYFNSAATFYKRNPRVAFMVINAMAIGACINYLDEFWQLYLRDIGFSIVFFGVFSSLVLLIRIPGNLMASQLIKHFREERILVFILGVTTVGFFTAGIFPGRIGIAAMVITFLVSGVVDPLVSGYLHHHTRSDIRATVDSFQSLGKRAIVLAVGIAFGYVSSVSDIAIGFVFLGMVCFLFLILFLKNIKNLENIN